MDIWKMFFPFPRRHFQVPCWFSGVYPFWLTPRERNFEQRVKKGFHRLPGPETRFRSIRMTEHVANWSFTDGMGVWILKLGGR